MDALVTVCVWNTNVIMVWAWVLWSPYALGTRTLSWFGHGRCCHRMLLEHERSYGLGMDALVTVCCRNTNGIEVWAWMLWSPYALGTRTILLSGHGCSGHLMFLAHELHYCLGMDALVTVCSWHTNVIMVWAWVLRSEAWTNWNNPSSLGAAEKARKHQKTVRRARIARRSVRAPLHNTANIRIALSLVIRR